MIHIIDLETILMNKKPSMQDYSPTNAENKCVKN
jgi:hypothetical protein